MSDLTTCDLFRSAHKGQFKKGVWKVDGEEPAPGILYGDITPRTIVRKGRPNQVRQDWHADSDGFYEEGHGTSLHDAEGFFGKGGVWRYFKLPEGTTIPDTLKIICNGEPKAGPGGVTARHWQIEVANGGNLTKDALEGALDNLARNCVVRLKELEGA